MNTIDKELAKVREIFLTEEDEETVAENAQVLSEWEQGLLKNRAYQEWKGHDITRHINAQARKSYIDHAVALATNRSLTDAQREGLWAKQDACLFILELTDQDAKGAMDAILRDIRHALNAT